MSFLLLNRTHHLSTITVACHSRRASGGALAWIGTGVHCNWAFDYLASNLTNLNSWMDWFNSSHYWDCCPQQTQGWWMAHFGYCVHAYNSNQAAEFSKSILQSCPVMQRSPWHDHVFGFCCPAHHLLSNVCLSEWRISGTCANLYPQVKSNFSFCLNYHMALHLSEYLQHFGPVHSGGHFHLSMLLECCNSFLQAKRLVSRWPCQLALMHLL